MSRKRSGGFLTDDRPPRRWLLWTLRGLSIVVFGGLLIGHVPHLIERVHNMRSMPVGAERETALDGIIDETVTSVIGPLMLLVVFGFGIFPRSAISVWTWGGPWFVPMWRADKQQNDRPRRRAAR